MSMTALNETPTTAAKPEICIWVDKYEDVFSDFDSRPFAERTLSDDFLREVDKMSIEKTKGDIRLKFHVLDDQINKDSESIIINNLSAHYKQIAEGIRNEQREILKKGYMLLGVGFMLILFIFFLTTVPAETAYLHGIILMLEPVGWFMTWTGLDSVFQTARKNKSALEYNQKMASADITFSSFGVVHDKETEKPEVKQKSVIPLDNFNLRVA